MDLTITYGGALPYIPGECTRSIDRAAGAAMASYYMRERGLPTPCPRGAGPCTRTECVVRYSARLSPCVDECHGHCAVGSLLAAGRGAE